MQSPPATPRTPCEATPDTACAGGSGSGSKKRGRPRRPPLEDTASETAALDDSEDPVASYWQVDGRELTYPPTRRTSRRNAQRSTPRKASNGSSGGGAGPSSRSSKAPSAPSKRPKQPVKWGRNEAFIDLRCLAESPLTTELNSVGSTHADTYTRMGRGKLYAASADSPVLLGQMAKVLKGSPTTWPSHMPVFARTLKALAYVVSHGHTYMHPSHLLVPSWQKAQWDAAVAALHASLQCPDLGLDEVDKACMLLYPLHSLSRVACAPFQHSDFDTVCIEYGPFAPKSEGSEPPSQLCWSGSAHLRVYLGTGAGGTVIWEYVHRLVLWCYVGCPFVDEEDTVGGGDSDNAGVEPAGNAGESSDRIRYELRTRCVKEPKRRRQRMVVMHLCDNSRCINPRHCFWGTMSANALGSLAAYMGVKAAAAATRGDAFECWLPGNAEWTPPTA